MPSPYLDGEEEARTILDRSAAFHAGLQSIRVTMEVRMELPKGLPGIPGSGPEQYAVAMARPRSLSLTPIGDHPGASFIQNDEQAYGELPMFQRYVVTDAVPFDRMTGEGGNEALAVPGSDILLGLSTIEGEAELLGEEEVGGLDCYHLSVKEAEKRVEVWIAKGEQPWLMRHRTEAPEMPKMPDKDESGSMTLAFMPGFDIRFSDWKANADVAGAFEISPRAEFTQADTLYPPPEEMGALLGEMGAPFGMDGEHPSVGKPAPEVSLQAEGEEAVLLSSLKGKVVVLDFWATWCQPCVIELPLVAKVTAERDDKGVAFFAVNTGESGQAVKNFLNEKNLDIPLVLDDDGTIGSAYGVSALPHLVIIDAEGTVRHVHLGSGPGTEKRLESEIDALLSLGGQTGRR
jgi:peroxiredoxin